jgi:hypothetical protein
MSFEGLVEFLKKKMIEGYEKKSIENKFELTKQTYSYFSANEIIKDSIKQDFDLYFGKVLNYNKKNK